jgi:hypothetical protein
LLKGTHKWRFLESKEAGNTGGTTFVQKEDLEGMLSLLFMRRWPTWLGGMRGSVEEDFRRFNGNFKKLAEVGRNRG